MRRCGPAMRCSGGKNGVKISCGMRMARSMLKLKCVFGSEKHDFHRKFMENHGFHDWPEPEMSGIAADATFVKGVRPDPG